MNQWRDEKMASATMREELRREDLQAWIEGKNARDRAWWRWPVGLLCAPVLALREMARIAKGCAR